METKTSKRLQWETDRRKKKVSSQALEHAHGILVQYKLEARLLKKSNPKIKLAIEHAREIIRMRSNQNRKWPQFKPIFN